jgi:hypothetical protein
VYATPRSLTVRQLIIGAVLIIPLVVFAVFRPALYASAVLVGLAASLIVAVGLRGSILTDIGRFRSRAFGLIAGHDCPAATQPPGRDGRRTPNRLLRSRWSPGSTTASTLSPACRMIKSCGSGISGPVGTTTSDA